MRAELDTLLTESMARPAGTAASVLGTLLVRYRDGARGTGADAVRTEWIRKYRPALEDVELTDADVADLVAALVDALPRTTGFARRQVLGFLAAPEHPAALEPMLAELRAMLEDDDPISIDVLLLLHATHDIAIRHGLRPEDPIVAVASGWAARGKPGNVAELAREILDDVGGSGPASR